MSRKFAQLSFRRRKAAEIANQQLLTGANPDPEGLSGAHAVDDHKSRVNPHKLKGRMADSVRELQQLTPPSVEEMEDRGVTRKALEEEDKRLTKFLVHGDASIGVPRMRTESEMREAPPGASQKNRAWLRGVKHALDRWRDVRSILRRDHEDDAEHLTDVETIRPKTVPRGGEADLAYRRMSATRYIEKFGVEKLSPVARMVLEAEAAEESARPQTPSEAFAASFGAADAS